MCRAMTDKPTVPGAVFFLSLRPREANSLAIKIAFAPCLSDYSHGWANPWEAQPRHGIKIERFEAADPVPAKMLPALAGLWV